MESKDLKLNLSSFSSSVEGLSPFQKLVVLYSKMFFIQEQNDSGEMLISLAVFSSSLELSWTEIRRALPLAIGGIKIREIDGNISIQDIAISRSKYRRHLNAKRQQKFRENRKAGVKVKQKQKNRKITDIRLDLFKDLQKNYHPERAWIQITTARAGYMRLLKESSSDYNKIVDKITVEKTYHDNVVNHIGTMKKTPQWLNGGTYLPGIGNLIASSPWKNKPQAKNVDENDERAIQLAELEAHFNRITNEDD